MCDDENIEPIDDADIYRYFGDYPSGAGYVLFYQAADLDLTSLGMKRPPTPEPEPEAEAEPEVFIPTRPAENLMDIVEGMEDAPMSFTTTSPPAKVPLKLSIPPQIPSMPTPVSPSRASTSAASTPTRERTLSTNNRNGAPAVPERQPSYSSRNSTSRETKDDASKWYQFNKKPIEPPNPTKRNSMLTPSPGAINTPSKSPSSSTNFGGLGVNVPREMHPDNANGVLRPAPPVSRPSNPSSSLGANDVSPTQMSTSMMSTTSNISTSTSSYSNNTNTTTNTPSVNSPPVAPSSMGMSMGMLGRKVSQSQSQGQTRDRTVSASSAGSAGFGSSVEKDKGSGGGGGGGEKGGLSRRLSGMSVSKLTRSGSTFKLGFGKKEGKDKGITE
jgi:ubiquitin carboxyl-terminal hydrolase 9/13